MSANELLLGRRTGTHLSVAEQVKLILSKDPLSCRVLYSTPLVKTPLSRTFEQYQAVSMGMNSSMEVMVHHRRSVQGDTLVFTSSNVQEAARVAREHQKKLFLPGEPPTTREELMRLALSDKDVVSPHEVLEEWARGSVTHPVHTPRYQERSFEDHTRSIQKDEIERVTVLCAMMQKIQQDVALDSVEYKSTIALLKTLASKWGEIEYFHQREKIQRVLHEACLHKERVSKVKGEMQKTFARGFEKLGKGNNNLQAALKSIDAARQGAAGVVVTREITPHLYSLAEQEKPPFTPQTAKSVVDLGEEVFKNHVQWWWNADAPLSEYLAKHYTF